MDRKKLRNELLPKAAEAAKENFNEKAEFMMQKGHFSGLIVDGYKNVSGKHIDSVILSIGGVTSPIALDSCGSEHDGIAVARSIEALLIRHGNIFKIKYVC